MNVRDEGDWLREDLPDGTIRYINPVWDAAKRALRQRLTMLGLSDGVSDLGRRLIATLLEDRIELGYFAIEAGELILSLEERIAKLEREMRRGR